MTNDEFNRLKSELYAFIYNDAPHKSGALKASIKKADRGNVCDIIIDIEYMPYTEERWIHPRWNGRENPNLYWLKNAVKKFANQIVSRYGGEINVN